MLLYTLLLLTCYLNTVIPDNLTDYDFPFVNREGWHAKSPRNRIPLKTPVLYVIIHHTATKSCPTKKECSALMRSIQEYHMDTKGWLDIGYNFAVGGDGAAYEARGWKTRGAHAVNFNYISIGISLIGDWTNKLPPSDQLKTTKSLIKAGVVLGYIKPNYKLIGHRQTGDTECPGDALFREIKTWDHYSPNTRIPKDLFNEEEILD